MRILDDLALLAGRLGLAILFLFPGISKATGLAGFAGFLESKGLPAPQVLAALVAAVEIGGAVLLALGLFPRIVAVVLAGFVVGATLVSHQFWTFSDAAAYSAQQIQFLKNVGLVGGLLIYFAAGPGPFALGSRRSA